MRRRRPQALLSVFRAGHIRSQPKAQGTPRRNRRLSHSDSALPADAECFDTRGARRLLRVLKLERPFQFRDAPEQLLSPKSVNYER